MKNDRAYVYVLRLQGSPANWYIGSTTNIEARICEHWAGQGAQWTQKHPPIGVVEVIECLTGDPLPLERAKTAEMAMKYGWARVRGAGHVKIDTKEPPWFDQEGNRRKRGMTQQQKTLDAVNESNEADTGGIENLILVLLEHKFNNEDGPPSSSI